MSSKLIVRTTLSCLLTGMDGEPECDAEEGEGDQDGEAGVHWVMVL